MVWVTNKAEVFARSAHLGSSMVMLMMSYMNPSIGASFALMSNIRVSTWASGSGTGCYSSSLSICLWGD